MVLSLAVMFMALPVWNVTVSAADTFTEIDTDFSSNPPWSPTVGNGTISRVEDTSMPGAASGNMVYKITVPTSGTGPNFYPYWNQATYLYGPFVFEFDFKADAAARFRIRFGAESATHAFEFWGGTVNKFNSGATEASEMTPLKDVTGANMAYNATDWYHAKISIDYGTKVAKTGVENIPYMALQLTNKTSGASQTFEETYSTSSDVLKFLQWYTSGPIDRWGLIFIPTGTDATIMIDNYRQTALERVTRADIGAATGTDKNGMFNRLSDTVHKFDLAYPNMPAVGTADYNQWVLGRYMYQRASNGTDATNTISITEPESGVKALDFHYAKGATEAAPVNDKNIAAPTYFDKLHPLTNLDMAFRIKRTAIQWSDFLVEARGVDETRRTPMFFGKDGYVYLMGNKVAKYEAGKWYDVTLKVDYTAKYAQLGLKEATASDYTYYDMTYSVIPTLAGTTGTTAIPSVGWLQFMTFCTEGTPTEEYHTYITNYMQNTSATGFAPTMNSQNDDFSGALADTVFAANGTTISGLTTAADNYVASNNGWIISESDTNTAVAMETLDGNQVLKLTKTDASTVAQYGITKTNYSANTDANAIHRFRFKMGGGGFAGLQIFFNDNGGITPFNVYNGTVSYRAGSMAPAFTVENETDLYDYEVIYNGAAGVMDYCVTSPTGKQFVGQKSATIGALSKITFRISGVKSDNPSSAATATNLYLDDFQWDILSGNATGTASIDGNVEDASLDEWVYITYNETVNDAALDKEETAPTVTVTSGGEPVETPYTLDAEGETLIVKFSDLDMTKEYVVTVSDVPMLSSVTTVGEEDITFTTLTAEKAISATKPAMSGNTISSTVTSCYAHGRTVNLIAALYQDGVLVNVKISPLNADSRTGESVSIDLTGEDYETIRTYVWSDFASMIPHSESAAY